MVEKCTFSLSDGRLIIARTIHRFKQRHKNNKKESDGAIAIIHLGVVDLASWLAVIVLVVSSSLPCCYLG